MDYADKKMSLEFLRDKTFSIIPLVISLMFCGLPGTIQFILLVKGFYLCCRQDRI